jgi:hypothetical protein
LRVVLEKYTCARDLFVVPVHSLRKMWARCALSLRTRLAQHAPRAAIGDLSQARPRSVLRPAPQPPDARQQNSEHQMEDDETC